MDNDSETRSLSETTDRSLTCTGDGTRQSSTSCTGTPISGVPDSESQTGVEVAAWGEYTWHTPELTSSDEASGSEKDPEEEAADASGAATATAVAGDVQTPEVEEILLQFADAEDSDKPSALVSDDLMALTLGFLQGKEESEVNALSLLSEAIREMGVRDNAFRSDLREVRREIDLIKRSAELLPAFDREKVTEGLAERCKDYELNKACSKQMGGYREDLHRLVSAPHKDLLDVSGLIDSLRSAVEFYFKHPAEATQIYQRVEDNLYGNMRDNLSAMVAATRHPDVFLDLQAQGWNMNNVYQHLSPNDTQDVVEGKLLEVHDAQLTYLASKDIRFRDHPVVATGGKFVDANDINMAIKHARAVLNLEENENDTKVALLCPRLVREAFKDAERDILKIVPPTDNQRKRGGSKRSAPPKALDLDAIKERLEKISLTPALREVVRDSTIKRSVSKDTVATTSTGQMTLIEKAQMNSAAILAGKNVSDQPKSKEPTKEPTPELPQHKPVTMSKEEQLALEAERGRRTERRIREKIESRRAAGKDVQDLQTATHKKGSDAAKHSGQRTLPEIQPTRGGKTITSNDCLGAKVNAYAKLFSTKDAAAQRQATKAAASGSVPVGGYTSRNAVAVRPAKIGDHSVGVHHVITPSYTPQAALVAPNAFQWAELISRESQHRVNWNEADLGYNVVTAITNHWASVRPAAETVVGEWSRFYDLTGPPMATEFRLSNPRIVGEYDLTRISEYRAGTLIRVKAAMDVICSTLRVEKRTGELLAHHLDLNTHIYDNRALFFLGTLLCSALDDAERMGINTAVRAPAEGRVQRLDITQNDANLVSNTIRDALISGRFILQAEYLSDSDIQCILALAGGSDGVVVGHDHGIAHVVNSFAMQGVSWLLCYHGTPPNLRVGRVTNTDMWSFLRALASAHNMRADFVRGTTLAFTWLTGRVMECNENRWWMNSMLEVGGMVLPMPRGNNFLWEALEMVGDEPDYDTYAEEWSMLRSATFRQVQECGTLIATMLSVSLSTVLHHWNITGRELNARHVVRDRTAHVVSFLQGLMFIRDGFDRARIHPIVCQLLSEISGCVVNNELWVGQSWCDEYRRIGNRMTENDLWQGLWRVTVPYMVDPLCVSQYIDGFPDPWGFSAPEMTLDLSEEMITVDAWDNQGWNADMGTTDYESFTRERRGHQYVTYGGHVINCIIQNNRIGLGEFNIVYRRYYCVAGRSMLLGEVAGVYQPEFLHPENGIVRIRPGSLITFDWMTLESLAPRLCAADMNVRAYVLLGSGPNTVNHESGIVPERMQMHSRINPDLTLPEMDDSMEQYRKRDGRRTARETGERSSAKNVFGSAFAKSRAQK